MEDKKIDQEIRSIFEQLCAMKAVMNPTREVIDFMKKAKLIRWYGIASDVELEDIWVGIREDRYVTDFICDLTVDFNIFLTLNNITTVRELGEIIGESLDLLKSTQTVQRPNASKQLVITDAEFYNRKPDQTMKELFTNNQWMTTLYMLKLTDITRSVQAIETLIKSNAQDDKQ